jgi:hypothetical protein
MWKEEEEEAESTFQCPTSPLTIADASTTNCGIFKAYLFSLSEMFWNIGEATLSSMFRLIEGIQWRCLVIASLSQIHLKAVSLNVRTPLCLQLHLRHPTFHPLHPSTFIRQHLLQPTKRVVKPTSWTMVRSPKHRFYLLIVAHS